MNKLQIQLIFVWGKYRITLTTTFGNYCEVLTWIDKCKTSGHDTTGIRHKWSRGVSSPGWFLGLVPVSCCIVVSLYRLFGEHCGLAKIKHLELEIIINVSTPSIIIF